MVLVVYVNLRFAHSDYNAYWRKNDVEALSETHQWHGGIQDNSLHEKYGKLWWKIGWVMIIPSALIHIPLYHSNKNTIGFVGGILAAIQCIIMIASFYPTEKALKKHFRDDTP